ncbi:DUF2974 domain-containing protein [Candidatus Saccharibacteria bacterium]|nr:DUF2974 domain-containing protein [Candidatus Saccharibacteria bacterium]
MSNTFAIRDGRLANNPRFFGSNTAEIIAYRGTNNLGSWNNDYTGTVYSARPWFILGGHSANDNYAGMFAFNRDDDGGSNPNNISHRTILLGY